MMNISMQEYIILLTCLPLPSQMTVTTKSQYESYAYFSSYISVLEFFEYK